MPIEFRCSKCDKPFRVKDEMGGKRAKCPACGTIIQVPMPGQAPEKQPAAESPPTIHAEPSTSTTPSPTANRVQESPSQSTVGTVTGKPALPTPGSGLVNTVAVVNFVFGVCNLACGCFIVLFGGAVRTLLRAVIMAGESRNPDRAGSEDHLAAAGFIGNYIILVGCVGVLLGLPALLAGYGVLQRRKWGRVLTLIMGGLATVLAILGFSEFSSWGVIYFVYAVLIFVVMLQPKYAAEFS